MIRIPRLGMIGLMMLTLISVDTSDLLARSRGGGHPGVSRARHTHSSHSRGSMRHSRGHNRARQHASTQRRQSHSARSRQSTQRRSANTAQRRQAARQYQGNRGQSARQHQRNRSQAHGSVRHSQYKQAHRQAAARSSLINDRDLTGKVIRTPRRTVGAIQGERGTVVAGRGPRGGFVAGKGENKSFFASRRYRRDIPNHYRPYRYRGYDYWYGGGYYYEPYYEDDEVYYVETYPPYDMEVEELPEGYEEVVVDGETYYLHNGVYYRLDDSGGEPQYVIAAPPVGTDTPDPMTILKQMGNYVSSLDNFSMTVVDTMDHVQATGEMIKTQTQRDFLVRRPNGLKVQAKGTDIDREAWYDGRRLTVYNKRDNTYGTLDAPDSLEQLIDFAYEQFQVSVPVADLLYDDIYASLADRITSATYVGAAEVDGVMCHHLSFSSDFVDWQLWVDAGAAPLPLKLVIDYKVVEHRPTYTAEFVAWDEDTSDVGESFGFKPLPGMKKLEITAAGPAELTVQRLRDELDAWVMKHQNIEDYVTIQKTIKMYEPAATQPNIQKLLAEQKAMLKALDPVSPAEIKAYELKKRQLNEDLQRAIRAMQYQEGT